MVADASGAASGGTLPKEFFFFKEHNVTDAAFGEMIGGAGSHNATADDDYIGLSRQ